MQDYVQLAKDFGFTDAALLPVADLVVVPAYRCFCEENLCGWYGANYSCPPDCGTPEEMRRWVQKHKYALVLRTVWDINDFKDSSLIKSAKQKHNGYTMSVIEQMESQGYKGFMVGASGCALCNPCTITRGEPCKFPNKRYSCMSAYCIYVKDLAEKCGMIYDYKEGALPFFSMYVYD